MKTPVFNSRLEQVLTYATAVSIAVYTLAMGYALTPFAL
jgi:hypothetical protein